MDISIHALREEGDLNHSCHIMAYALFLSTPSARRATQYRASITRSSLFLSTPSARRATPTPGKAWRGILYFYPRPPRGGRPETIRNPYTNERFLSTPSARRATSLSLLALSSVMDFYPRPPRGGRLRLRRGHPGHGRISIHALREEGDVAYADVNDDTKIISIHALREEGDSKNRDKISIFKQIIQHSARI